MGWGRISEHQNFNSQPHEEADKNILNYMRKREYFNSQPHEEADIIPIELTKLLRNFNSQPHEEADHEWTERKSWA